ncbi:MAG TPA: carbohydrate ABC transporter permease [Epulopiscium sp.]|nr:carbohydrate ABC transporter permease [Candidatus Epulonipiscium sp.]
MDKQQANIKTKIKVKQKITPETIFLVVFFTVLALLVLFPIYCIVLASFKPSKELLRFGLNIKIDPAIMSWDNYKYMFTGKHSYFMWFKNILFTCVLIIMMVPMEIIMLPLYKQAINMKIIDSVWGIILPFIASPAPIFFFRQYLGGIPKELMEAGRIDGCTEYDIFGRIFFPLMAPSFAAMGIFVGMNSWNGFLWPLIVLRSPEKLTLPIGLATLITPYGNNYDILITGSVLAIIPILVLFLSFQRYFIEGMTAGGVKG